MHILEGFVRYHVVHKSNSVEISILVLQTLRNRELLLYFCSFHYCNYTLVVVPQKCYFVFGWLKNSVWFTSVNGTCRAIEHWMIFDRVTNSIGYRKLVFITMTTSMRGCRGRKWRRLKQRSVNTHNAVQCNGNTVGY